MTASLFDPLGILSPLTITLKMLFQVLCTSKANWDVSLHTETQVRWEQLMKDLVLLSELKIPRCCFLICSHPVSISLHGLSDASEYAYVAVLYLSSLTLMVKLKLTCCVRRPG